MTSTVQKILAQAALLAPRDRDELIAGLSQLDPFDDVVFEPLPDHEQVLSLLQSRLAGPFLEINSELDRQIFRDGVRRAAQRRRGSDPYVQA